MTEILTALTADRVSVAKTLALAFQDDPALAWIMPDPDIRRIRLPLLFDLLFRIDHADGLVLRSAGNEAATLWRLPGRADTSIASLIFNALPMLRIFGTGIGRGLVVSNAIDAHHPKEPFLYLHFVGTRPPAQGKGFGGAVIREGLKRASQEGVPVYLETATRENVGLYKRLGFDITAEWDVPNGPHFWSMLRPADSCFPI